MSENFDHMEMLLRRLKPQMPNPELRERIGADLKLDEAWLPRQVRRAPRWLVATGWAGLGAAAAVVALAFLTGGAVERGDAGGPGVAQSVEVGRVQGQGVVQPVRVWSVERRAWIDPTDGAEIMVEIPKADGGQVVLPVNFQ
jgi:anti-sigma-K factor RskA